MQVNFRHRNRLLRWNNQMSFILIRWKIIEISTKHQWHLLQKRTVASDHWQRVQQLHVQWPPNVLQEILFFAFCNQKHLNKNGLCIQYRPWDLIFDPFCLTHRRFKVGRNVMCLKMLAQTKWIKTRPHKMWGLIFDPYCLTPINYVCRKLK